MREGSIRNTSPSHPGSAEQPAASGPVTSGGERSLLIDQVKGLAIALVALGHTNQGELSRGWWGASGVGVHLNAFIYSFHMPAFFFVSGVFLGRSAAKRGALGFFVQKVQTILYPFLLWSLVLPLTAMVIAPFVHVKPPEFRLSLLSIVTGSNAWFLPALFVALVLGMLLRRAPYLPLFLASCVVAFFWPVWRIPAIDQGIAHLPFVVGGMWLGRYLHLLRRISAGWSLVLALTLGCGLYFAAAHVTSQRGQHVGFLPAGFL